MPLVFANFFPWTLSEDTHWLILVLQSVAFVAAVAIILRLVQEKRTPSNITSWSLFLLFLPLAGVPFYLLFGGRKIRRLIAEKSKVSSGAVGMGEGSSGVRCFGDPLTGNSVRVLGDGVEAYRAFCKEIDAARERIDIATFILGNDPVGRRIVNRLALKAREGVRVRLLIDALGSFGAKNRMFSELVEAGGTVERFIPLSFFISREASANLRNHRKIAVFDDRLAIAGGQNMDKRFLSPSDSRDLFADLGLMIEGPAVGAFIKVFDSDWAFACKGVAGVVSHLSRQPMLGSSELEVIPSGPDVEGDALWESIITLVQEARHSITIVSPYFLPDEVLLRSLIIKAHAGRHVRIVVPENSNHAIVDLARNRFLRQLSAQGIEILMYRKRMLHAKLIMVDGRFAVSGSANIDPRSFFVNFEIGIVHYSPGDIRLFEDWMDSTILPHCVPFALSRKSRESRARLFAENLAHLFTPFF
jgi:cardiolipin synthase A/B